jgi:hypothetical protein
MTDDRKTAELLADRAGLAAWHPDCREVWIKTCIELLLNARKESRDPLIMVSDLPEPIRHHAMDTLASVAQSIRAAYCWGLQPTSNEQAVAAVAELGPRNK